MYSSNTNRIHITSFIFFFFFNDYFPNYICICAVNEEKNKQFPIINFDGGTIIYCLFVFLFFFFLFLFLFFYHEQFVYFQFLIKELELYSRCVVLFRRNMCFHGFPIMPAASVPAPASSIMKTATKNKPERNIHIHLHLHSTLHQDCIVKIQYLFQKKNTPSSHLLFWWS